MFGCDATIPGSHSGMSADSGSQFKSRRSAIHPNFCHQIPTFAVLEADSLDPSRNRTERPVFDKNNELGNDWYVGGCGRHANGRV